MAEWKRSPGLDPALFPEGLGQAFEEASARFHDAEEERTGVREAQRANVIARQSLLSAALKLARLGPWEYDAATDLFTFNDYFYAIYRTTAEREGGYQMSPAQYAERFLRPEDRHYVGEETRRAFEVPDSKSIAHVDHPIIFPNGEIGYISVTLVIIKDEAGRTLKTYGVNQDITERVRAEQELADAHEQLRVLHENVEEALVSYDVRNEKVLYVSPGQEQVFGYPPQAFKERPSLWLELILPEDRALVQRGRARLEKGEQLRTQFRIVRPDGIVRWVEARLKPTLDENETLVRADGIVSDITDRVEAETKRRELEAQLRQAQRVESLGTLAGGIAHDFNNILGIIVGYTAILASTKHGDTGVPKALDAISRATARGSALVNQLLTFARATDVSYTSVDVNEIIRELVKLFAQTFPKNITTEFRLSPDLPRVHGSAPQIHQMLLNLAINSRDAMPNGGSLTITTDRVPGHHVNMRFPKATAPEYVRIQVEDTGVGMSESVRQRIFEPFFTTKGAGKGTGLGLAVVFGIVEGHGGHIAVDSEPGKGTRFSLYLKPAELGAPLEQKPGFEQAAGPEGSETILLVEDEELLRGMLQSVLESRGYRVLTAADGAAGVEAFRAHPGIAAVVTDMGLPEMNGVEVVRKIHALDDKIKCIVTSGYMTPEMVAESERVGVHRSVSKPYDPAEILRVLRRVLDE